MRNCKKNPNKNKNKKNPLTHEANLPSKIASHKYSETNGRMHVKSVIGSNMSSSERREGKAVLSKPTGLQSPCSRVTSGGLGSKPTSHSPAPHLAAGVKAF